MHLLFTSLILNFSIYISTCHVNKQFGEQKLAGLRYVIMYKFYLL